MNIRYFKDYDAMSQAAAQLVYAAIQAKPNLLLCAATGNSPTGLYLELQRYNAQRRADFKNLRLVKLDEWVGLHAKHPATCEYYLQQHLIRPLGISPEHYIRFDANTKDPEAECNRLQAELDANQPIDICVLGMGVNGHLGLNEPAAQLTDHCHVAHLAATTLDHTMVAGMETKPAYGLTLGMKDILAARHILLLVTGAGKEKATYKLTSGEITNEFPATHLWAHPKVDCLIVK
jgi:galactosamine-6-phosphate isomerase